MIYAQNVAVGYDTFTNYGQSVYKKHNSSSVMNRSIIIQES